MRARSLRFVHLLLLLCLVLSTVSSPLFAPPAVYADPGPDDAHAEEQALIDTVMSGQSFLTPTTPDSQDAPPDPSFYDDGSSDQPPPTGSNTSEEGMVASPDTGTMSTLEEPDPPAAAPKVSITSPIGGTTITGTIKIHASATADVSRTITLVEFYFDNLRFADDSVAPYSAAWDTLSWTLPPYDGPHSLTVKAYDNTGQVTTSAPVAVTVANTAKTFYSAAIAPLYDVPLEMEYNPVTTTQELIALPIRITNTSSVTWAWQNTKLAARWYSVDSMMIVGTGKTASGLGGTSTGSTTALDGTLVDPSDTNDCACDTVLADPYVSSDEGMSPFVVAASPLTAILGNLAPGQTRTITVTVSPPVIPTGVDRSRYRLQFDLRDTANGVWFAEKGNKPNDNPVIINKTLMDEAIGLERYYHYIGEDVGAGMQHLANVANGNSLLRWTPWQAPGRGLSTVLDLTYNSLERRSNSQVGNNFSLAISGLTRFGAPLDIHPNNADKTNGKNERRITFTDGDGTAHTFTGTVVGTKVVWQEPPGVHLYLRSYPEAPTRAWALTRPDRVTFYYDQDGYPTSIQDANGNRLTFTLEDVDRKDDPGGPRKRITKVTDAAGQGTTPAANRSFTISYFTKEDVKKAHQRGLVKRITDHSGSALDFQYYEDGNLLRIIQRGTYPAPERSFVFTYTTSNGAGPVLSDAAARVNPNPKTNGQSAALYSVRDPRGAETRFAYYGPGSSQDRWKLLSRTDRAGSITSLTYDIDTRVTTVTEPLSRVSSYAYDTQGQVTTITNPLNQATRVSWSSDRQVAQVIEPTGEDTRYFYNANGQVTDIYDQLNNRTNIVYDNYKVDDDDVTGLWKPGRTIPHLSQPRVKTSPQGTATSSPIDDYQWRFDYDSKGNVLKVFDPVQLNTRATADEHATTYTYNPDGTVKQMVDANGNATTFISYDANGMVTKVIDPISRTTTLGYTDDGLLRYIQDPEHQDPAVVAVAAGNARGYRTYFDYDAFHRMYLQSTPKATVAEPGTLIWSRAYYNANDQIFRQTPPRYVENYGGPPSSPYTAMSYDPMDRLTWQVGMDTSVDPNGERTLHTYDAAGRRTRVTQPKGVFSTTGTDFTTDYTYDALDRVTRTASYDINASGTIDKTTSHFTHFCYSLAGDLVQMVPPSARTETLSCSLMSVSASDRSTRYVYDAAHRQTQVIEPLGRKQVTAYDRNGNVTSITNANGTNHTERREYDERDALVKTISPFVTPVMTTTGTLTLPPTSYTDERPRDVTTVVEYDWVGNRSRMVSPRGWDAATVNATTGQRTFTDYVTSYTYDGANQLIRIALPKETSKGANDAHYLHRAYDLNGRLEWSSLPVTNASAAAVGSDKKTTLEYFDTGWIRKSAEGTGPATFFEYSAEGWQETRTPAIAAGKPNAGQPDTSKQQRWTYNIDGTLQEHKAAHAPNGGSTKYTYDANNNQLTIRATAGMTTTGGVSATKPMTIENTYDSFNRVIKTRQQKQGEPWKVSTSSYDTQGNIIDQLDDKEEGSSDPNEAGHGKHFTYDIANRLTEQIDYGTKPDRTDDQRTTYDYLATNWEENRTVAKASGTADWTTTQTFEKTYYASGQVYQQTTKDSRGVTTESHTVSYEDALGRYADGNQTNDAFTLKGPNDVNLCTGCNARSAYDARGRLTSSSSGFNSSTNYTLDPVGNITNESTTSSGVTSSRSFTYSGTQMTSMSSGGAVQERYFYDGEGNLDCTTTATGTQASCPTTSTGALPSNVVNDYGYDYENRVTNYRGGPTSAQGTGSASYSYDALGRQDQQTEQHGTSPARTTQFGYEGLSDRVSTEQSSDSTIGTKSYSYDGDGQMQSMTQTQGGTSTRYGYGYDTRGNVSQLLNETGKAKATYGYTPYGSQLNAATQGDGDKTKPLNSYRFQGKRFDSGSGNLQMGARMFGPNTGRFLQPDQYMGAFANLGLALDPLTQNRSLLAGANPINFVEVDGHYAERNRASSAMHTALDACGLVFDACDVANAATYALEGDWKNAATSAAGAIPGIGIAATGAKYATKAAGAASTAGRFAGKYADEAASAVKATCSFTPDTPVATADGAEAIGDIDIGDLVLAYDEETDTTDAFTVTAVLVHRDPEIVHLTVGDERIETTPEHPFFTEGYGWVAAGNLEVGDRVRKADGTSGVVQTVEIEQRPQLMYNLTVAVAHTFFVGDGQWLVHNSCNFRRLTADEANTFKAGKSECYYCGRTLSQGVGRARGELDRARPVAEHVYSNELAKNNGRDWNQEDWDKYLNDPDGIIVSCKSCNSKKGYKQLGRGAGQWWPERNGENASRIYNTIRDRYAP